MPDAVELSNATSFWRYLPVMLRRFIYLDRTALDQYVTGLEGGRTTGSTTRLKRTGTGSGGFDAKVASASGERSREEEESKTIDDTDEARFSRLLRAAADDPETLGWIEVMQPDTDFDGIGLGAMVDWECDLYVPEIVQLLARSGESLAAIEMMQNLLPMAKRFGPSSAIAATRSNAARTAGSVSPSTATGVPHTAMTASPMNFSTTPPYRVITVRAVSK